MQFDKCNLCFVHMFSESFFFFLHLADVGSLLDNVGFDHLSLDEVESVDFIDTLFFVNVFLLQGQEPAQGIKSG